MTVELVPLSFLKHFKSLFELCYAHIFWVVQRFKMWSRHNQFNWNARFCKNQRPSHPRRKGAFVEYTRIPWQNYSSIATKFIMAHHPSAFKQGLNVGMFLEELPNLPRHLLQTNYVSICLLDFVQHGSKSLRYDLLKPNIISQDTDNWLTAFGRQPKIL